MRFLVRTVFVLALILGSYFAVSTASFAGGLPETLVPCGIGDGPFCRVCDLAALGQNVLNFLVFFSLIFSSILFVNAGALYLFSPAKPANISKAHRIFTSTLVGILFILTSWLVVNTIMVNLYNEKGTWDMPWNEILCADGEARPIPSPTPPSPAVTDCSSIRDLTPLTDPLAIRMEGGQTVIWENTDPQLRVCAQQFISSIGRGSVTSAYRPPEYQTHLWEIRNRWCDQGLRSNTDPACSEIRSTIQAEVNKHFGSSWNCGAVARTNSTHSNGTGVDIGGIGDYSSTAVQSAAKASCLNWPNYSNDPYHYTLLAGCSCQ